MSILLLNPVNMVWEHWDISTNPGSWPRCVPKRLTCHGFDLEKNRTGLMFLKPSGEISGKRQKTGSVTSLQWYHCQLCVHELGTRFKSTEQQAHCQIPQRSLHKVRSKLSLRLRAMQRLKSIQKAQIGQEGGSFQSLDVWSRRAITERGEEKY